MDITELIRHPKRKNAEAGSFRSPEHTPLIPPIEVNQFYENAIAAEEFTIMVERRIKDAMDQSSKKVDIEKLQMICWK